MRGPWAWTGAGYWGMSWPTGRTWNSCTYPSQNPANHPPPTSHLTLALTRCQPRPARPNPNPATANTPVDRPALFDQDFGAPLDETCLPQGGDGASNVFFRRYAHATATLNCTDYTATIQ